MINLIKDFYSRMGLWNDVWVSLSVRDENTLKREIEVLKKIDDNYPKILITLDQDNSDIDGIKIVSAIDFLMGEKDI
mgnify:CR=1 FL=1